MAVRLESDALCVVPEETEAGLLPREASFAAAGAVCHHDGPSRNPLMSSTAAVVLSLRRNMVLKTPWVKDRIESDTALRREKLHCGIHDMFDERGRDRKL